MTNAFTLDAAGQVAGPEWLVARRRAAAERFAGTELPTNAEEVWRYSRIGDLDLDSRRPADPDAGTPVVSAAAAQLRALAEDADPAAILITVDGQLAETHLADGGSVTVGLADDEASAISGIALDQAFDAGSDPLGALHDAFATPTEVDITPGAEVGPVVAIHYFTDPDIASFPHLVVRAGQNSRVEVLEIYASDNGVATLAFPVTEFIVGRDATLRHASIQLLGDQSWQLGRLASTVGQNATLRAGTAAFGSDYSRLRIDTALSGRGANGELYAGYFGSGSQLLDFRTFQDHRAPDTTSNLLFKGALADKSASVYTGLIKIRPEGRGSQAFQTNRNLKLSEDTFAESVPNLEIENNEVQCSHASAVGPIDAEQRFYLESRGVPPERAERLIVKGMFDEVFDALGFGPYESLVRDTLDTQLESTEFGNES